MRLSRRRPPGLIPLAAALAAAGLLGGVTMASALRTGARSSSAAPASPAPGVTASRPSSVSRPTGAPTTVALTVTAPPTTAVPPGVAATPANAALAAGLAPVLANTDACLEVSDAAGHLVYSRQPDLALSPASTQKLLVAAAALDVLGPGYRFATSVVAARAPAGGQVGQAWLVGGGDPVLSSPEYTRFLTLQPMIAGHPVTTQVVALANQLAAAGIRSIPGGIHGDDSRYDRTRSLPGWNTTYVQEGDVAPLGALEVDDGLDRWHPAVETADPAAHAAGVLARLAGSAGIATAQAADGDAPSGAVVLAAVQSPPLADIVTAMLRQSDNTTAEMLTRELDRVEGGRGTTPGGVQVVMREAAKLGLSTAGLSLVDGSGLSPQNRASCATLLGAAGLASQPRFVPLGLLSVAGRFGTLYNRFLGTPMVGRLAAKTGNIAGVMSLVGHMDVGPPLNFAFLLNGPISYLEGVGYEDRVVAAIGAYRGP